VRRLLGRGQGRQPPVRRALIYALCAGALRRGGSRRGAGRTGRCGPGVRRALCHDERRRLQLDGRASRGRAARRRPGPLSGVLLQERRGRARPLAVRPRQRHGARAAQGARGARGPGAGAGDQGAAAGEGDVDVSKGQLQDGAAAQSRRVAAQTRPSSATPPRPLQRKGTARCPVSASCDAAVSAQPRQAEHAAGKTWARPGALSIWASQGLALWMLRSTPATAAAARQGLTGAARSGS